MSIYGSSIISAIISARMSSKKKKAVLPKARPKKAKSTFDKEWIAKLSESDNQEELLNENDNDCNYKASKQAEIRASCPKVSLQLQETVKTEEIDKENWTKLKGRSIVLGESLQEHLRDEMSCRSCKRDVNIMENTKSRNALGSSWIIRCQNESCPSRNNNSAFTITEKGKGIEAN